MLGAVRPGTLDEYERLVERLASEFVDQDGSIWGFLYKVEDRARSEYAAYKEETAEVGKHQGGHANAKYSDYDTNQPWEWVYRWLTSEEGDRDYWEKEFRRPCEKWKLEGKSTNLLTPSDHLLGFVAPGDWAGRGPGKGRGKGRKGGGGRQGWRRWSER